MQKKFTYQSAEIAYHIEGNGKAVVLLHGFGEDSDIWKAQVEFLKAYCLVIVPDLPGSGQSQMLLSEAGGAHSEFEETFIHDSSFTTHDSSLRSQEISIVDYADCIYALLTHENISSCTLLGHSMGGYITIAFAEKYPSLLNGFGLINSTAFADSEEKKKTRQKGIAFIEQYGAHAFLKTSIPNLFAANFKENHPEKINELIRMASGFTSEALQQYYRAMMARPDRTQVLVSNPLPVLFVMGTEDLAVPFSETIQQTYLPDKSYIHVLPNAGHMSMWEAPEKLNLFILDFLNR